MEAGDIPAVAALAARTWSDAFGEGLSPEVEAAELAEGRLEAFFAATLAERTTLVAEVDGELAGYVQFGDAHVHRLYVETPLQGRGLGRRLLEAALRHPRLAEADCISLQVWEANARAVRLYESAGFERAGTTRFTVGDEEMEDLVMVRRRA
jgi:ribosomal protein S18 acetylase RimI-like enzyme